MGRPNRRCDPCRVGAVYDPLDPFEVVHCPPVLVNLYRFVADTDPNVFYRFVLAFTVRARKGRVVRVARVTTVERDVDAALPLGLGPDSLVAVAPLTKYLKVRRVVRSAPVDGEHVINDQVLRFAAHDASVASGFE